MLTLKEYLDIKRVDDKAEITYIPYDCFYHTGAMKYSFLTNTGKKSIYAFIAYPDTEMPKNGYPAALVIHGGGGEAYLEVAREYQKQGFVTIVPDFSGNMRESRESALVKNPDAGPIGYGTEIESDDPWNYFSVLQSIKAIDLLYSIDDIKIDKNNIFSIGLSWGGIVNLALLSVEKRIKAGVMIYSSGYTELNPWWGHFYDPLNEQEKNDYLNYLEPKNFLDKITVPVLFSVGADDPAFTLKMHYLTTDKINSDKYFSYRKSFPHGNLTGFSDYTTYDFIKALSSDKEIKKLSFSVKKNTVKVKRAYKKSKIKICYTFEDINEKEIVEFNEEIIDKKFTIYDNVKYYFILEENLSGAIYSTDIIKAK